MDLFLIVPVLVGGYLLVIYGALALCLTAGKERPKKEEKDVSDTAA